MSWLCFRFQLCANTPWVAAVTAQAAQSLLPTWVLTAPNFYQGHPALVVVGIWKVNVLFLSLLLPLQ